MQAELQAASAVLNDAGASVDGALDDSGDAQNKQSRGGKPSRAESTRQERQATFPLARVQRILKADKVRVPCVCGLPLVTSLENPLGTSHGS